MDTNWTDHFLDKLLELDAAEAPHGLYGIRQAYFGGGRLPTLAEVLSSPKRADFLGRCGFQRGPSWGCDRSVLRFSPAEGFDVRLRAIDFASTKIRQYGNTYRLDKAHGKPAAEKSAGIELALTDLQRDARPSQGEAILFVAHFVRDQELETLLSRAADPSYRQRYGVSYAERRWADKARGFQSIAALWWAAAE